jgi:hypothetical protein
MQRVAGLCNSQGDEQSMQRVGDGIVDDGGAELMDPIGGRLRRP